MRSLLVTAALLATALPAAADPVGTIGPYVPVDANNQSIVFIDLGAHDSYQGRTHSVTIVMQLGPDGKPVAMIGGLHMDCKANTLAFVSQATIDRNGSQGAVEYLPQTLSPQPAGTMGAAIVQTVCTGTSPNTSTKDYIFDTLPQAWDFGANFLTSKKKN